MGFSDYEPKTVGIHCEHCGNAMKVLESELKPRLTCDDFLVGADEEDCVHGLIMEFDCPFCGYHNMQEFFKNNSKDDEDEED